MVLVSLSPLRLEETSAKLWYSESILAIAFFNCGCLLLFFFSVGGQHSRLLFLCAQLPE